MSALATSPTDDVTLGSFEDLMGQLEGSDSETKTIVDQNREPLDDLVSKVRSGSTLILTPSLGYQYH